MKQRHLSLKNATKDDLHRFGGGAAFAEHPNSRGNRQQYYGDRSSRNTEKFLTIDDAFELIRETALPTYVPEILKQFCAAAGGRFLAIPELSGSDSEVMHCMADLCKEHSDTVQALSHAAADGEIDPIEAQKALKELDEMDVVSAQLRAHLVHLSGDAE